MRLLMIEVSSLDQTKHLFQSLDKYRKCLEDLIQEDKSEYTFYCSYCERPTNMQITFTHEPWTDLRGEFRCKKCNLTNRDRLFWEAIRISITDNSETMPASKISIMRRLRTIFRNETTFPKNRKKKQSKDSKPKYTSNTLIFERVTHLFKKLSERIENLHGVEFGGYDLQPGQKFFTNLGEVQHEDMQNISFSENTFDLVLHSDVLEHVPNPIHAMKEVFRILKPGGICLFSTPIYSNRYSHKQTAVLENGHINFLGKPLYHGNPLSSEGTPVFFEFGLNLINELHEIDFRTSYLIDLSLIKGAFSNNHPLTTIGHMWPIVVKCVKPRNK